MKNNFKKWTAAAIGLVAVISVQAQAPAWPKIDKSPLDLVYFPNNLPLNKLDAKKPVENVKFRVLYSRPQKNNRTIFGADIVPYGKVWRLGANEATELETFVPVTIGNKKLPAGRYTLYALVNENDWTFIVNKETDIWGAYKYEESKDLVRVKVPVQKIDTPVEALGCKVEKTDKGANLVFAWDTVSAALPISF
ncbi:MAG: DUF2911 domain-containing protein [Chitinophagaceae bacterium]|nr:MAG: DUF2911 domain-containing protein [Chitinophagaceae bacterium]